MLATVGRYFDPWEAYILQARLIADGIPASIAGDRLITTNWPMSIALGGVALQVPAGFLEQAEVVIAAYHSGELQQELMQQVPSATDTCPACGSVSVMGSVPMRQRALNVVTFLVASAPFPTSASRMTCRSCDHQWEYGD